MSHKKNSVISGKAEVAILLGSFVCFCCQGNVSITYIL